MRIRKTFVAADRKRILRSGAAVVMDC